MLTLDGVMQSPGRPNEDPSNGFEYGGWVAPHGDETYKKAMMEELNQPADYLLGRKTFEIFERYWPQNADFWPGINEGTKYVMSNTRKDSAWKNSVFINSLAGIKKLKKSTGPDIQVWGSGELNQILFHNGLVDELRLKIFPLTIGKGKKLFANGAAPAAFTIVDGMVTAKGVILVHYRRSGKVKTGRVGT